MSINRVRPWIEAPMPVQLDLFSNQANVSGDTPTIRSTSATSQRATPGAFKHNLAHAREALRCELQARTQLDIRLRITDNTSTLMSIRYNTEGTKATVNLHHMFLDTSPIVLNALARWVLNPKAKKSGQILNTFIRERCSKIRAGKRRTVYLQALGKFYDLKALFDEVNQQHFDNNINAAITWGKMPRQRRRRRSIRFGSYTPDENIIRMHPLLDQSFVPKFFIRYIVFHEMLHAKLGIEESPTGKRRIHSPEFNRIEKTYPDYERAIAWMDSEANLARLLNSRKYA